MASIHPQKSFNKIDNGLGPSDNICEDRNVSAESLIEMEGWSKSERVEELIIPNVTFEIHIRPLVVRSKNCARCPRNFLHRYHLAFFDLDGSPKEAAWDFLGWWF
ncbi:unnamed protein product [Symbiodinium natans]|uniref:Uncharacterized protein n=1 Tax=Symbiodinium natans TaxID=878477 RepID=A0A812TR63_9DINO|nr:unnamed protein product [Symbiodinium natans]